MFFFRFQLFFFFIEFSFSFNIFAPIFFFFYYLLVYFFSLFLFLRRQLTVKLQKLNLKNIFHNGYRILDIIYILLSFVNNS